jgi:peptide-methionine (S)-S-oxide reductase
MLTVVIPNYDGAAVLPACLASVARHAPPGTEVIVVDNGSADGSEAAVAAAAGAVGAAGAMSVSWLPLGANTGFGTAANRAARVARGDVLLILNSDATLLTPIDRGIDLVRRSGAGIVGARMVDANGRYVPSAGARPRPGRLFRLHRVYRTDGGFGSGTFSASQQEAGIAVDWVHGSFLLVDGRLFATLGGFDERIFLYGEETELCRRVRDTGRDVVFLPSIEYAHASGYRSERFPLAVAGWRLYVAEHEPPVVQLLAHAALFLGCTARAVHRAVRWAVTRNPRELTRAKWAAVAALECLRYPRSARSSQARRSIGGMALFARKALDLPTPETALPGRDRAMPVPARHEVLGHPLMPPFPDGLQQAVFGLGCFWGAERKFWQTPGVWTTAAGYAGGLTPNPTYEEVCSGRTGHTEAVLVVFDPAVVSYASLLQVFWESHDPTQGMRQGNDVGTQYRSAIYTFGDEQRRLATESRDAYQQRLRDAGHGAITTEIRDAPPFFYAEDYHQQYLAPTKNPDGYCGLGGTGVSCPVGVVPAD